MKLAVPLQHARNPRDRIRPEHSWPAAKSFAGGPPLAASAAARRRHPWLPRYPHRGM